MAISVTVALLRAERTAASNAYPPNLMASERMSTFLTSHLSTIAPKGRPSSKNGSVSNEEMIER